MAVVVGSVQSVVLPQLVVAAAAVVVWKGLLQGQVLQASLHLVEASLGDEQEPVVQEVRHRASVKLAGGQLDRMLGKEAWVQVL